MPSELSTQRWRQVEALFVAAIDLPADEQAAFIERECADDPDLRRVLAGMLAHAAGAAARIAGAVGTAAQFVTTAPDEWIGRRFGAYRIVREIGRGGMGLVFEAVRDDEYRRRVALKVAPWSRDVALLRQRFLIERQILAELDHPNIAQFFDGGTEHDVPYFVMEYVEGRPLTRYCEEHRLDLRARIVLLRQVCGAVHFAHEHLVVHRDLKPANILVREDGTPKLLDFGIAKLLDPFAGSATTVGERMWTPDYTSPEQVRGRPITTRTDVYSLGLILYELLTGTRAQIADTSSPVTLDRSICETEPPLPSERAAAQGDRLRARRLRGDLDTIVMTATSKEPERRYRSVSALSDDLGRYLDGAPILARPSTWWYRAGKLLRRHRASAVAAALVLLAVAAGLIATLYQARRAERRFQQVRQLANVFVFDVHDRIEKLPGSTEARKAIVSTALTYLENLRADAGSDRDLARELAAAYLKIGNVQGNPLRPNLGDTKGAIVSYGRAEEILKPLVDRGDRDAMRDFVSLSLQQAVAWQAQGDAKGMATFGRARDLGEQLLAQRPADRDLLALVSEVHEQLARISYDLRDYPTAEKSGQRAMQLARRLVELDPGNKAYRDALSSAYTAVGQTRHSTGHLEESADDHRAAIAIREQLVREDPDNAQYRRNLLIGYGHLGDVLGYRAGDNLADAEGAIAAFYKAVEIATWLRDRDPADRRAAYDLVNARVRLGTVLADAGLAEAGLKEFEEAARLSAPLLQQNPTSDLYRYLTVLIDRRLGDTFVALHRTEAAARAYERARTAAIHSDSKLPNMHVQRVLASVRLARLRAEAGDARALTLADFSARELARAPLAVSSMDAGAYADLGRVYLLMARHASPDDRTKRIETATTHLETSAARWHKARLSAALEPQRTKALAAIEADLAACRSTVTSR